MESHLRQTTISLPELFLVAGTRALLGAGAALLLANRLTEEQRKAIGWTLVGVGAVTTVPLAIEVLGGQRQRSLSHHQEMEENSVINRQEMI